MNTNDLKGIAQGLINTTKKALRMPDDEVEKEALRRAEICVSCPLLINNNSIASCSVKKKALAVDGRVVRGCGCMLHLKWRQNYAKCPRGLW